jgi:predicted kinase
MRKWMRERLTRRKKKDPETASQPAPPPLQPAYFDAEQSPPSPPADTTEASSFPEAEAESQPAAVEARPSRARQRDRQSTDRQSNDRQKNDRPRDSRQKKEDGPTEARRVEARPIEENASLAESVPESSAEPSSESRPAQRPAAARGQRGRRRGGRGRGGRGREQAVPGAIKEATPALDRDGAEGADDTPARPSVSGPGIPAAIAGTPRPPKGIVVLAIGLPGSGKSSWFKRHAVTPLSSDMVRSLLFDDVREQRFQDLVFSNLRSMLKARLIAKRPTNYVDATNLTPQERQHWIKLAKDYNYEVHAVFFDVPLDVCLERHQRRDRVVPEDVMRRMAAKMKAPAFEEGFAKITVVRVKKKEE